MGFSFENEALGDQWIELTEKLSFRLDNAVWKGALDVSDYLVNEGRKRMAASGNFGSTRWQQGLGTRVTRRSNGIVIDLVHDIPYARIHEFGGVIKGNPLLWIPLSWTGITVRARDYPDPLFRVDRKSGGRPLLLSSVDKKPKYFGIEEVTIPPRWGLRDLARETMGDFQSYVSEHLDG